MAMTMFFGVNYQFDKQSKITEEADNIQRKLYEEIEID